MQTVESSSVQKVISDISHCPSCGGDGVQELFQAPDRFHGRRQLYQLAQCPNCLLVWLKDPPPPTEMAQHYGEDYDRAIAGVGEDPDHWKERRNAVLNYKSGGVILDLGCSSGGFLRLLKSPSWKLHGIEMSSAVAHRANANCGGEIFVGDILDATFSPGTFDVITCFHVFEHLYQPREVLARVSEWLKPGGIFYTNMPNIDSAGAHVFRSYWYALELPRHLYHFSPTSLNNLATSVGLEKVSLTTHRELFVESSLRYIVDDLLRKIGIVRAPLARAKVPSIPFRVVRKAFRWTILPLLNGLASVAGDGESIHAVFAKPQAGDGSPKSI